MKRYSKNGIVKVAISVAVIFICFTALLSAAETAEQIMRKVDDNQHAASSIMKMSLQIYPTMDSSNRRDFLVKSIGRGEEDSYMEFVAPRSIKGLRVLSLEDSIRVYFPSTGRLRRITGKSKGGSVGGVGGDFSYEDMGSGTFSENYTSLQVVSEDSGSWVIKGIPTDRDSSYSQVLFHIDRAKYLPVKIEYFTGDNNHRKSLAFSGFHTFNGNEIATRMTMVNHQKNRKTVIEIHDVAFNIPLEDKYFNPNRFYK
jgi:hypothetical protein